MILQLLSIAFILGAIIGSFLNVCIGRIPLGQSIVSPPSACPHCGHQIRWYENIPLLSYLFLRGRCSSCQKTISPRYPLIEALTGGLFALVLYSFGFSAATPVYWLLASALVVISFIDLDHQIIPDIISLPGILLGFVCSFFVPWLSWSDSLLGILLGGGILYAVAWGYQTLTRREGMGGGDIKLLAMLGAFLGWQAVLPVIFFASILGLAVAVPLMLRGKADARFAIPFGPFLALAALLQLFWGRSILFWYLSLFS